MSECTCHKNYTLDTLIPKVGVITDIREETPDVKTFRVNAPEGGKLFEHMPGQCAMLCAPGISEGMFSITSSPTNKEYQEFSIKKCGMLTDYLHSLEVGDEITVRGPYGNHFPVEDKLKGKERDVTKGPGRERKDSDAFSIKSGSSAAASVQSRRREKERLRAAPPVPKLPVEGVAEGEEEGSFLELGMMDTVEGDYQEGEREGEK